MQASAAGHVIDYDNGTYTAMVDALWPGKHTITITLTFQRELIRAMYVALHQVKLTEDICIYFFEVNTKYISSSELKTSKFSRMRSTSENLDVFKSRHDIYLVFTDKK